MKPEITKDIIYIGQDDTEIRLFESQYVVPEGMCYNSYLILDDKIAIMDTSDPRTLEAWKKDLVATLDGKKPDYLIVQHMEPDHSSGIAEVLKMYPDIQVVCTAKAAQMMPNFFQQPLTFNKAPLTVKEGDTLSLGKHVLTFVMAPMVHWPEVMVTYDQTDKVLFSADGFGKFGVITAEADDWACEARRYYFNICGKYGAPVSTLLKKAAGLDIKQILPLHGPILRDDKNEPGYNSVSDALRLYGIWSTYGVEAEGVFVAYASIHGCTKQAAEKLADILKAKGCKKVSIMDLSRSDQAEAIEDAFKYGKIVLAASSYDAGLFPPMYDFIHHLQIKAWQNREVALIENGSWAPSAGRVMKEMVEAMKNVTIKGDLVTLRGKMKESDIPALESLADALLA